MKNFPKYLFAVLVLFLISNNSFAEPSVAQVDGNCFLENDMGTHEGTTVTFLALTPLAVTDSCMTDASGYFQISLADGQYSVSYSHTNYYPQELPEDYFFVGSNYSLPDLTLAFDWGGISGEVSGIWTSENNPHRIIGDTRVSGFETLEIQAGVEIQFMGNHSLIVTGTLLANGAVGDSIQFTSGQAGPAPGDWNAIRFQDGVPGQPISEMDFCVIEYGGSDTACLKISGGHGIIVENSYIRLSGTVGVKGGSYGFVLRNSSIADNTYSGAIGSGMFGGEISGNLFFGNGSFGIYVHVDNEILISKNRIFQNGSGGVDLFRCSLSRIYENEIFDNLGPGIRTGYFYSNSEIVGNLITDNLYGIFAEDPQSTSSSVYKNTVVGNHRYGISVGPFWTVHNNIIALSGWEGLNAAGSGLNGAYNAMWGNNPEFGGQYLPEYFGDINSTNANGDPCDIYANIIMDPGFTNQALGDYSLLESSPCIDAGNPDPEFNDPDGTIADMGAFSFDQSGTPTESQSFGSFKSLFR